MSISCDFCQARMTGTGYWCEGGLAYHHECYHGLTDMEPLGFSAHFDWARDQRWHQHRGVIALGVVERFWFAFGDACLIHRYDELNIRLRSVSDAAWNWWQTQGGERRKPKILVSVVVDYRGVFFCNTQSKNPWPAQRGRVTHNTVVAPDGGGATHFTTPPAQLPAGFLEVCWV